MAMALIPFSFFISTLRASLVISLIFLPAVRPDSNIIRQPSNDPCRDYESDKAPLSCPVKCFRTDPVCGEDSVTYWCGCEEARCAAAKIGFCEVRDNGGAAAQALLLLHILWLIVLGFSVLFGLF